MKNIPINELIKQRRLEKNISVDTIFKEIHVPSKFVYMIENGEWEKFPSEVHLKGFLKIYADYLKIEPALVEKCIKDATESGKEKDTQDDPPGESLQKIFKADKSLYLLLLLALILIILYLSILYLLPE